MNKAEIEQIEKIKFYKNQLSKTKSKQRQFELHRHIKKLENELNQFRFLKYGRTN